MGLYDQDQLAQWALESIEFYTFLVNEGYMQPGESIENGAGNYMLSLFDLWFSCFLPSYFGSRGC
jgi:hypothetical protein